MNAQDVLTGKRFLVVEDNAFARDALCELLAAHGAQVIPAEDGEKAVLLFACSQEGAFDAALVDLQMPGLGGFEAVRTIRRMNRRDAGRLVILTLSSAPPAYSAREAMESGADACLHKPVNMRELGRILACANGSVESGGSA